MLIDKAIFKTNGTALFITDKNYIAVHIIDIAQKSTKYYTLHNNNYVNTSIVNTTNHYNNR